MWNSTSSIPHSHTSCKFTVRSNIASLHCDMFTKQVLKRDTQTVKIRLKWSCCYNAKSSYEYSSIIIKCRENQLSFSLVQILQKIFLLLFLLSSSTAISHIWTRSSHVKWLGGKGTNIKNKEKLLMTFSSIHSRSFCLYRIRQYFCHNFRKGFYTSLQLQKAVKL